MPAKPYYITTAIAYASGKPHIGNSYEVMLADAEARYRRAAGYDVRFMTGTDEHGQKIEEKAKAAGVSPKEYVDKVAAEIRAVCDRLDISYDRFIRTTDADHEECVRKIFRKMYESGDIYKGTYEGMYCVQCESFFTPSQLVDGKCPDCGREVRPEKEEAYFFRMSKYAGRLLEYIEEHPDFIVPQSRKNEMINNFLKPGLQDLCVSRTSFSWGVPVDFAPGHVVYVWLDALTNYISGLGYDPDGTESETFEKYWPADCHVIGKDILRFHTIYWPIFLMSLGLPLPRQIFGHPWLLSNGCKIGKSFGNAIYADDLIEVFGVDAVRYCALAETPYAGDGNISWESVSARYNADLANNLGNLVSRSLAMVAKYFGGVIPEPSEPGGTDGQLIEAAAKARVEYVKGMESFHIAEAAAAVGELVRRSNKYIDENAPWALARDEKLTGRLGTVLYNLLESIRHIAVMYAPVMPRACAEILRRLNASRTGLSSLEGFAGTAPGTCVVSGGPALFPRTDEKEVAARAQALAASRAQAPAPAQVSIEEFSKVKMTVCKVISCEKVPGSEKLLQFTLDDGSPRPRRILSGVAAYYSPEQLTGKTVVACVNLPPRKMMGIESEGMLLSAEKDGRLDLLMLDDAIPAGAKLC